MNLMIENIQKALETAEYDAILLTSEINRRYATGFHSSAGVCYISRNNAYFFTDFRYIEAARAAVKGFEVREVGNGLRYSDAVNACIAGEKAASVALEDRELTYADYKRWRRGLQAEVRPMDDFMERLRAVKTEREVALITAAQRIAERALAETLNDIRAGATEKQIAARLTYLMLLYGAENMSFDPIVVSGANASKPHGVPTEKPIEAGDFVTMDFGCVYQGYCSDMTRTVAVQHCTQEMHTVYDTVLQAQAAGIAAARAGVSGSAVDGAARAVITRAGYGDAFGHGFGHGVGLYIHEAPSASMSTRAPLPAGAILTAEPGIYLPGKFGVRIEDMLYIREKGCENLTKAPKELVVL